jgi:GDP/UDP-N,N'-diacetylbacillosamine 2-epimerase (hydrolysing)
MKKKYKILCMTGTRADYPRIKPVLKILGEKKNIDLKLFVTGQHVEKKFGLTINEIKKDKFKIFRKAKIFSDDDSISGMNTAFKKCYIAFSNSLKKYKPDLVLLTVDRIETIACSSAALTLNYPIAHVQGGEVTGTMDETLRHCVTKMSNVHFVANKDAYHRLLSLGENPKNIFNYGCPYAEEISKKKLLNKKDTLKYLKLPETDNYILFVQHPVTTEIKTNFKNYKVTVDVLKKLKNLRVITLFSNADAGGQKINEYIKKNKNFINFSNLNEKYFLSIMKYAKFMIGNSSAGIREAPTFKIPVINIGTRQSGRLRSKNIIDCNYSKKSIENSIFMVLNDKKFKIQNNKCKNLYQSKNTSKKIVLEILRQIKKGINIQKKFYDKKK